MSVKCELCYHHCELAEGQTGFCRARICRDGAVVRSITLAAERCHVEITTLLVPGKNDSVDFVHALDQWLASVSPDIPLHLSRFFPRYQMQDRPPTPVERVYQLAEGARNWLTYVYTGNC